MIPSYDDLTPGIPDDIDPKSSEQLAFFLREDLQKKPAGQEKPSQPSLELLGSSLYACLRGATADPPPANSALPTADCQLPTLLTVARDCSPRVMAVSASEVLLDVSGLGALIGEPPAIAHELARALRDAGSAASVAIAPTQTAARLQAARPEGPLAPLADLPVEALRPLEILPPAMNHRDRDRPYDTLARWGIATLGDLAALPAAALSSRLGRRGTVLQRLARGLDLRPFVPDADTPRFTGRLELEWPIDALEPLSFVLARLLDPLSAALERADRGAVALRLDLRLTDRTCHTRQLQLPAPIRDPRVLRTLLLLDLESHPPQADAMIDVVAVEIDPAPGRITQFSLLQRALPSPETLSTLTARLAALVGESRVGTPVLEDTHRPGVFAMAGYAPEQAVSAADPATGNDALVLRRQRHPSAIRVGVERGRPVHVAGSRRGLPHGAVLQAAGPWRTSGAWWGDSWNRDEWDVALAGGAVCRIFQDRTTERWFLEGIYD